jgi:signal transduction histidine kinase
MFDRASDRQPIAVAVPDRPVPVRCDPDRLQRVMENLASNAIKYSPDGGLVEITLDVVENAARLSVRDHGIGIPASDRTRIFERGYRAPGAMQSAPGLGLGLSISSEIVRQHGGSIEAAPAEGKGSIVTVRITLAPSARRKDAPMAAAAVE